MNVYTVYDVKAELYLTPFFERNDATALRSFKQACTDPSHGFCRHAEDYTLFRIGEFNEETAKLTDTVLTPLARAIEFSGKMLSADKADAVSA